jgi:GINS complex subunit 4
MVNTLRSDPQTSEEEHFKLMLVMTEMERVKYLIRSYIRTRLSKVSESSSHPSKRIHNERLLMRMDG